MSENRLLEVFKHYLDDTISPEELAFLFEWMKGKGFEGDLDEVLTAAFANPALAEPGAPEDKEEVWAALADRMREERRPFIRRWLVTSLSAAAAVLLVGGYLLWHKGSPALAPQAQTPAAATTAPAKAFDAPPGIKGATLTLANGSVVSLDPGAADHLPDQQGSARLSRNGHQLVYAAGATGAALYNLLKTARGREYTLVLSDGTKAWLNAGSSIRFPVQFEGNRREVEVTGEVYFEVATEKDKPFVVRSGGVETTVLGTHFDVMSYSDEPRTEVTLLQGSVRVNGTLLTPGEQANVSRETGALVKADADGKRVTAWTRGLLDLDNGDFGALMRQISRWYDVDVVFEGMPKGVHIGGLVHRDVRLSMLLGYLADNGVHYKTEGKTITILP
ncbi:FecR family protein [Dinghuibacter silviterrae]|nr:FecR family protein [Dinghuibacter silviterrae]